MDDLKGERTGSHQHSVANELKVKNSSLTLSLWSFWWVGFKMVELVKMNTAEYLCFDWRYLDQLVLCSGHFL